VIKQTDFGLEVRFEVSEDDEMFTNTRENSIPGLGVEQIIQVVVALGIPPNVNNSTDRCWKKWQELLTSLLDTSALMMRL
jgi:hypothetical protein